MGVDVVGPGFEAELAARPDYARTSSADNGRQGFLFSRFAFKGEGYCKTLVHGAQIGWCPSTQGLVIEAADGRDHVSFAGACVAIRTPRSVTNARWNDGFAASFLTYSPVGLEHFFHVPTSRISFLRETSFTPAAEMGELAGILQVLERGLDSDQPMGDMFVESLAAAALHVVMRADAAPKAWSGTLTHEQAARLRDLIQSDLGTIALADLAAAIDLSIGHMTRVFRATFGATPYQYILRVRGERALELLATTRLGLDDIAVRSGFEGRRQMCRTVKMLTGKAPRALRN